MNDAVELTFKLARAACPQANVRCYKLLEGGPELVQTSVIAVKLTGANIAGCIKQQGPTPAEAVAGIEKKWRRARRAWDIARLIEECERIGGQEIEAEVRAQIEYDLTGCDFSTYNIRAAKWRTKAVAHARAAA